MSPPTKPERKMTITELTAAMLKADSQATQESVATYIARQIELYGEEAAKTRIETQLERMKGARRPSAKDQDRPIMIRDNYKGRSFYRRADASEIHDM